MNINDNLLLTVIHIKTIYAHITHTHIHTCVCVCVCVYMHTLLLRRYNINEHMNTIQKYHFKSIGIFIESIY